ncbi:MAG: Transcription-repair-coupling factor [Spirochaetes bacterium ADurb.Bin218]|jgi:transcription-repair coupling factor (superfamily II helicase)|nr:MAG: Transcription-repair-coupling factor [Spirochaetes bacterium ADurb.Bin218]HOV08234.1 transcription-repair coupling factor [Spirochaetota bacterium]
MILKELIDRIKNSSHFSKMIEELYNSFSIEGVSRESFPFFISLFFYSRGDQILVVTENQEKLNNLYNDLTVFVDEKYLFKFPSWEILPYEFVYPLEQIERERITAIYRILSGDPAIVITSVDAIMRKIPSQKFFLKRGLALNLNEEYPFDDIINTLVEYGYTREAKVEAFGQFSVKGGIIDVFLPSRDNPIRIDFFGDTVESIREFNPETQVSIVENFLDSITIYPRRELVLFKSEKEKLKEKLSHYLKDSQDIPEDLKNWLNRDIELDKIPGILDYFHDVIETDSIVNFFPDDAMVVLLEWNELLSRKNIITTHYEDLYRRKSHFQHILPPETLLDYSLPEELHERSVKIQSFTATVGAFTFAMKSLPNFQGRIKNLREEIAARLSSGWNIVMTTSFEGQARRLFDLFSEFSPNSDFSQFNSNNPFNIVLSPLSAGLEISDIKTFLLTDHDIFGKSYRKRRTFKSKSSRPIESFLDLKPGDYVVHINHGIGIFKNIERMTAGGVERDFLVIQYEGEDRLYVSLEQISLVQKYIGLDGKKPRIDALGKKSAWNRIREKVRESVEEIARELIKIYSQRSALKGFRFPPDTQWQEEFEALFEYEETPDQISAIEDVKDDMESDKPMDRLICGDVGFGKTEVAIRASFKACMAGKQVAILVPTTILAMQHFETFKKRFKDYPVSIEMVSRFRTKGEIIKIKDRLSRGEIDIVIGTHALLSADVKIKNMGLLIIDEEQRFGVKHKEQLKKFRATVDVLTLSATPIPRTLHISMSGIRDLSIIATPPENRQPIETYVLEDNADILRDAIIKEIQRGGQVFYVHNRVQTIEAQMVLLRNLVPEAKFCIAHGQMHEHELEDIMIDFLNRKYDVLISTTIIESGLDMPNVNTIIINRADTFGLSQLYQLKGRVGRSDKKAYAYLFYPKHISLTEEAQKRLQVISEYSDLGSGFKIAMKDLEIRGAGNILGLEQSGNIMDVGFDLYCQMLEEEVRKIKGEEIKPYFRTSVFFKVSFYIPETYIADEKQKIEFYKRFEACETVEEVDVLEKEMIDRFGAPPEEVRTLVELERIRALASRLYIEEILEENNKINIKITSQCTISPDLLLKSISSDKRFTINPKYPEILQFTPGKIPIEKKLMEIKKWLQQFLILS